ncbi:hypothetical protein MJO29_017006, partial [Puccinia striiformis f. sp. tritici]
MEETRYVIPLTVAVPERSSLSLITGRTYNLQGSIEKLDDGLTTALQEDPTGSIEVWCLLSVDGLDVPLNTRFTPGSQISL